MCLPEGKVMALGMSFPLAGAIGNWQNRQLAARTFLPTTGGGGGGGGGARIQVGGGGAFLLWHRSDTATNTEVQLPHGKHYRRAKLLWSYLSHSLTEYVSDLNFAT